MIAKKTPQNSRLIRSVKGEERDSLIDVESAIEASSDTTTIDALSRRGVSALRVLDRRKASMLIRQAVNDALDEHAARHLKNERSKQEQDGLRRIEQLLRKQQSSGPGWTDPSYGQGGLGQLAALLNNLMQFRGGSGEVFPPATGQQASSEDRFAKIESRMDKLMDFLEKGQGSAAPAPSRAYRSKAPSGMDQKHQSMLKQILDTNLELQSLTSKT